MKSKQPIFYWHIHHRILIEPLTEPLKNRIEYIKYNKPEDEIALRLKLLKPVKGKLPTEVVKAWEAYTKAGKAYTKARDALVKARDALVKARKAYDKTLKSKAIIALHKIDCECGWSSKKQTIFTKANNLEK